MPRTRVLWLCAALLAIPTIAHADDPRREQASHILAEGIKLAEQHDEAGALKKFEEAYRVYPSPNALYNVAREKQLLGRDLDALKDFRECRRNELLDPSSQAQADHFIAELSTKTGHLIVQTSPGASLTVDGQPVTLRPKEPVDVMPGSHQLVATLDGKTGQVTISVDAGESKGVTLTLSSTVAPPQTEEKAKAFPPPTGAIILGGVGLVGLGLGIGFGLAASSKNSDFEDAHCAQFGSAACVDLHDANHRDATISVVSYIAGGALVAAGAVWWIVAPRKETTSVALSPWTDRGTGGLQLHGRF